MRSKSSVMSTPRLMRGMTLIELMTVVLVLAILSTFAVSSYRTQLIRTNRTDARQTLLRIQVAEEKFFLQNSAYTADIISAPPVGLGIVAAGSATPRGFYTVAVTPGGTGAIASSFLATASTAGTQTADTTCPTLSIDDQGQRTPADTTGCWK